MSPRYALLCALKPSQECNAISSLLLAVAVSVVVVASVLDRIMNK